LDYAAELIVAFIPLPILLGFIFWMIRLQIDQSSGRRMRLSWKDLTFRKKLFTVSLLAYFAFVVYLGASTTASAITGTGLPFEGIESQVLIWMLTSGLLGLGFQMAFTFPRRK
jgi:hypothetical protein